MKKQCVFEWIALLDVVTNDTYSSNEALSFELPQNGDGGTKAIQRYFLTSAVKIEKLQAFHRTMMMKDRRNKICCQKRMMKKMSISCHLI